MIRNRISRFLGDRRENISEFKRGAGISYSAAFGLYHEKSQRVDLPTLEKVCRYLGKDIGEVLYLEPPLGEEGQDE